MTGTSVHDFSSALVFSVYPPYEGFMTFQPSIYLWVNTEIYLGVLTLAENPHFICTSWGWEGFKFVPNLVRLTAWTSGCPLEWHPGNKRHNEPISHSGYIFGEPWTCQAIQDAFIPSAVVVVRKVDFKSRTVRNPLITFQWKNLFDVFASFNSEPIKETHVVYLNWPCT